MRATCCFAIALLCCAASANCETRTMNYVEALKLSEQLKLSALAELESLRPRYETLERLLNEAEKLRAAFEERLLSLESDLAAASTSLERSQAEVSALKTLCDEQSNLIAQLDSALRAERRRRFWRALRNVGIGTAIGLLLGIVLV
jgi:septal ring factor EnvC (AmiA/AmiB activator)